jgi:hypothetical protein
MTDQPERDEARDAVEGALAWHEDALRRLYAVTSAFFREESAGKNYQHGASRARGVGPECLRRATAAGEVAG